MGEAGSVADGEVAEPSGGASGLWPGPRGADAADAACGVTIGSGTHRSGSLEQHERVEHPAGVCQGRVCRAPYTASIRFLRAQNRWCDERKNT